MNPEPAPRTGSSWRCPPPPGAGIPKRRKKSLRGSLLGPPPSGAFSITSLLTTAGPYLLTRGEKSGSDGVHTEAAVAADATCQLIAGQAASAPRVQEISAARCAAPEKFMSDSGVGE